MPEPRDTPPATARPAGSEHARAFPEGVPVLVDPSGTVLLRAHREADLPRVVEQCRDPESIRWTTVPVPDGGYSLDDARSYLQDVVGPGWERGESLGWVVAAAGEPDVFCGSIDLRLEGEGVAEVGFGLHPAARGRHLMSAGLRLVRDHAFDALGLSTLRWRAAVGNWPSRRVAARAGFVVEGRVRRLLPQRGERQDGWVATLTADDRREPLPWLDPPVLRGDGLRLRPFTEADVDAVVEACADLRTQHWLVSLPRRYGRADALAYLEQNREQGASATGRVWCVADAEDDRCLGAVSLEGGGYSRRAEIGYWSHPTARGRGVTTAAVRMVTAFAEGGRLVDSLLVRAAAGNAASRRVAEAAGYHQVGVLPRAEPLGNGTVDDLVLYARP